MTSALYRNYLRLLEKWPLDLTKKGRDLGEHLRSGVAVFFRGGTYEPRDTRSCEEICSRLNYIVSDRYKNLFFVSDPASASGVSSQDSHKIISNEFLEEINKADKPYREQIKDFFKKKIKTPKAENK